MVHQEVVTLLVVPVNGYMASVLGTVRISLTTNGASNFTSGSPSGSLANDAVSGELRAKVGNRYLDGRVDEVRFHILFGSFCKS